MKFSGKISLINNNTKSHQKIGRHPFSGEYIFGETTGELKDEIINIFMTEAPFI